MKITEEIIARAKEIPILEVAQSKIDVKYRNGRYVAMCISPNHADTHPSMYINVGDKGNFCHCFGCQENWDTIQFIRDIENVTFNRAIEILAEMFPMYFEGVDIENTKKSYWKGLSYNELSYLGIPSFYHFNNDETDKIGVRDIALHAMPLWMEIVNSAIEQKKRNLYRLNVAIKKHGLEKIPDNVMGNLTYEEHITLLEKLKEKAKNTY